MVTIAIGLAKIENLARVDDLSTTKVDHIATKTPHTRNKSSVKLTYKLQRELDRLPALIEKLESDIVLLQSEIIAPSFYDRPFLETGPILDRVQSKQKELDVAVDRWAELEEMQSKLQMARKTPENVLPLRKAQDDLRRLLVRSLREIG